MDIQMKKGLLDVCVLAVLMQSDSYGWQIIKDLSTVIEISESTLYPVLKRLESSSFVKTYDQPHNGRLRRYYKITPSGINKIKEFDKEFDAFVKIFNFVESALLKGGDDA